MEYKTCVVFVFMLSVVRNQCSGEDLKELFNSDHLCHDESSWTINEASSIDKHNYSNVLTPRKNASCIISKPLSLYRGGTIQLKVYARSITSDDYLTVLVYDAKDNNAVGEASLFKEVNMLQDGWHDVKIRLRGVGHYEGYISLLGKSSLDSDILVVAICYSTTYGDKLFLEDTSKSASYNQGPDIYSLQTGSALIYKINSNEDKENEQETDAVSTDRYFWIFDTEDFWTPLTISIAVIIPLLILILLSWACFALGKRKGAKQQSSIVYEDIDNLPKPYVVPRVKNVYTESITSSPYTGRNNNIYTLSDCV